METSKFILQMSTMIIMMITTNISIYDIAQNWHPRSNLQAMEDARPATHLFHGNSTMVGAFDREEFLSLRNEANPVRMAFGGTATPEHYLIYKAFPKHQSADLYYGFYNSQLTEDTYADWSKLTDNRAVGYFCDQDDAIRMYTDGSWFEAIRYRVTAAIPMLLYRSSIWIAVEARRRVVGGIGMPRIATTQFGRVEDFKISPDEVAKHKLKCQQHAQNRVPLNDAVSGIFKMAKQHRAKIYVIEMPMNSKHRQAFNSSPEWLAYRAHITDLIHQAGGTLISAIDWVDDENYVDALHVDQIGAKLFTRQLAETTGNEL